VHVAAFIGGLFCCLGVALDAFQTIILPRRPTGRFQLTRIFLIASWAPWVVMAERARNKKMREQIYSVYGPLSLLLLLLLWALLLISGFALFYFSMHSPFGDAMMHPTASIWAQFGTDFTASAIWSRLLFGLSLVEQARTLRVAVLVDAALAPIGLVVAIAPARAAQDEDQRGHGHPNVRPHPVNDMRKRDVAWAHALSIRFTAGR